MDWFIKCIKDTCAFIIALSIAMAIVFGGWNLYDKYYQDVQVKESEPIKLQDAGPAARSM